MENNNFTMIAYFTIKLIQVTHSSHVVQHLQIQNNNAYEQSIEARKIQPN